MKRLDRSHLYLMRTALNVRDRLRLVPSDKLDSETARVLAWAVRSLSHGLKARSYRPARDGGKELDAA